MSGVALSDLWHARRLFGPKARASGRTGEALAELGVETDHFARGATKSALASLALLAKRYGEVRAIDVDVESRKMSADAAASFREMFEAISLLEEKGKLAPSRRSSTVDLETALLLEQGALPRPLARHVLKTAALEVYRLFSDPVRDAELHVLAEDHLRRRHRIPASDLLRAEVKPELTLREESSRKSAAALALLTDRTLPRSLTVTLLRRLGEHADVSAIPSLERIAAERAGGPVGAADLEIVRAAKAAIHDIRRAAKMTIVLVAMEVKPYCGSGGLANVMSELPRALAEMGHRVIVISPRHELIDPLLLERTGQGGLVMGGARGPEPFTLMKDVKGGVEHYFIENDAHFSKDRPGIYGDGQVGYADNAERYDFFGAAVPSAIRAILGNEAPDVVQLNDAHTASAAVYLGLDPGFEKTKTVLAVHNLGGAYQGKFSAEKLPALRFEKLGLFEPGGPAEFFGDINFLKLGLEKADAVITVSREYMKEILTEGEGEGLHGVLRRLFVRQKLWGNLNGIDNDVWNPATDPLIPHPFSFADRDGKSKNKRALQGLLGLPERPDTPVIGLVARLTDQKGFDAIVPAIERAIAEEEDVQFVIAGDGDPKIQDQLEQLAARSDTVRIASFSPELEHLIYAGSDFFLMPSKFEPCGLPQMYSLRYSTIPIVSAVGGLEESIDDFDPASGTGNGFKIRTDLEEALDRALDWYRQGPEGREALLRNAALADFSWKTTSAVEQVAFYRKVISSQYQSA